VASNNFRWAGAIAFFLFASSSATAWAGAWTQPKGKTWFRAGTMFQSTNERYFIDGSRIPYFFEGHNRTVGLFFDFEHGVTERLEVNAHLPFFGIAFNDLADDRQSHGIGDVRAGARYNVLQGPLVATIGGRIKFPTGEFVNDAEIIPVGEGQYDFEVRGELARSFWPRPAYVTGLIGYKFRTKNEKNGIDYGDEIFWSVEGGYHVTSRIMLKAVFWGLYGLETTAFDLPLPSLTRQIAYLEPGILLELAPSRGIEVSVPFTLWGQNWPAGPVVSVGFYQRF
jgi:hypothetical protein